MVFILERKLRSKQTWTFRQLVDRYLELKEVKRKYAAVEKEIKALEARFKQEAESMAHDKPVEFQGTNGLVKLSPCSKELEIPDLETYLANVSEEEAMATLKISVTDARQYLPPELFNKLFVQKEGSRKVTTGKRSKKSE